MKYLIIEGREIQDNFSSTIREDDMENITQESGFRIVRDMDSSVVMIPRNFNAVRLFMDDTKWIQLFTNAAFTRYQKQKYTIYFILLKEKSPNHHKTDLKKMAVVISPSGEYTCYDSTGAMIDITNVIKFTGIPRNVFKQIR
jgi:hypothetical protein